MNGGPPPRVRIVRSGGFAGLRREWEVAVDDELGERLDRCPWDDAYENSDENADDEDGGAGTRRDAFSWSIEQTGPRERSVRLGSRVPAAWREVIDRVTATPESERPRGGRRRLN